MQSVELRAVSGIRGAMKHKQETRVEASAGFQEFTRSRKSGITRTFAKFLVGLLEGFACFPVHIKQQPDGYDLSIMNIRR